ncbi:MAG: prolyl oligopeptidase family serine peptidase [Deltaproteobacteria bacterium]|nr:prolyl oligopeptidase family serine peptidase [Deltaproteobacteria bacterium]MCB9789108.1 prolyl oligopeptidase family serine peptidase [Deltaproteobacteria bacterium]
MACWLLGGAAEAALPSSAETTPAGTLRSEHVRSQALGQRRAVQVWLPPGYARAPERRYPVIYALHGLGGSDRDFFRLGHLGAHLRRAIADGTLAPVIVVAPDGDNGYWTDHAPRAGAPGARWGSFVAEDLVAWVDARYRTVPDRAHRALVGVSMGGYGALSLALTHPKVFGAAVSLSGALFVEVPSHRPVYREVWGDPPDPAWFARASPQALLASLPLDAPMPAIYLHVGKDDPLGFAEMAARAHRTLAAREVEHVYRVTPGGHTWSIWEAETPRWLAFVGAWLGREAAATPRPQPAPLP